MIVLRRLLVHYLLRFWPQAALTYVCLLGTTLLGLVIPQVIRQVIDFGLSAGHSALVARGGLLIVLLSLFSSLLSFGHRYLHTWLAEHLAYDLRSELYDKLQRLPFSFHDHTETGQLMSRCTTDVNAVLRFCGWAVMQAINSLLLVSVALVLLFKMDWRLSVVCLMPLPLVAVQATRFRALVRPLFRAIQQQFAVMTTVLQENLLGAIIVRAFAREQFEINKFGQEVDKLRTQRLRAIWYWVSNNQLNIFLFSLSTTLLLLYGVPRAIAGSLTVGVLVAFSSYLALLAGPIQSVGEIVNSATEAAAAGERIFEILDTEPAIRDAPDAIELPPIVGEVVFDNVSFRYQSAERALELPYALENISFRTEPNQVVAIVGPTGSGKSTLVSLIPRFHDVTSGAVLIDGYDVRRVTLRSLRRQIGIVFQEPLLFTGTIRENIAYGRPDASFDEIVAAAKVAQAHDFIMAFPDGYDTLVGERGYTLSGGQRQRISIARAILINPRILILDDATSSVDTETEHLIQQALTKVMRGRTVFIIAQRLTTVKRADIILVLDKGRIVEKGTHEELLAAGGLYRRIYELQLRDQEEAALRMEDAWLSRR